MPWRARARSQSIGRRSGAGGDGRGFKLIERDGVDMMFLQTLVNGLITGASYALFSVGLTLIFGVHNILNLAHGAVFTWGALIGLWSVLEFGAPWPIALLASAVASALLSAIIDVVAFRPLERRGAPETSVMLASIGVGLVLSSLAQQATGTKVLGFPVGSVPAASWNLGGLRISSMGLIVVGAAVVLTAVLMLYLRLTQAGRETRAVAENPRAALLVGINPTAVHLRTFLIAGMFAGIAGFLLGSTFNSVSFMMGDPYLLIGMSVIILGGMGSVVGALLGSLFIGLVQAFTVIYVSSQLSQVVPFIALFLVLVFRPEGIFASRRAVAAGAGRV